MLYNLTETVGNRTLQKNEHNREMERVLESFVCMEFELIFTVTTTTEITTIISSGFQGLQQTKFLLYIS